MHGPTDVKRVKILRFPLRLRIRAAPRGCVGSTRSLDTCTVKLGPKPTWRGEPGADRRRTVDPIGASDFEEDKVRPLEHDQDVSSDVAVSIRRQLQLPACIPAAKTRKSRKRQRPASERARPCDVGLRLWPKARFDRFIAFSNGTRPMRSLAVAGRSRLGSGGRDRHDGRNADAKLGHFL